MVMAKCESCGNDISSSYKYCPSCGSRVVKEGNKDLITKTSENQAATRYDGGK